MSVDVEGLRRTIRNIEEQMKHLGEEVDRLRRIADDAEAQSANGVGLPAAGLDLPREIVVPHPEAVAEYIGADQQLTLLVQDMATALVGEFRGERSEIELDLYQDPEIEDHFLVLYVRAPEYEDGFMDRLDSVAERFNDRRSQSDGWVLVTSDFEPIE